MERPLCAEHEGAKVVRAGWYGRAGQRRQRWLCKPDLTDEATWHRFAEALPRIGSPGHGHSCLECATQLEPWEGQPAPRLYGFHARDVAIALTSVAQGTSYRAAAEAVRLRAGRPLSQEPRESVVGSGRRAGKRVMLPPANRHAQLVSDWVDTFGPVVWDHYAATEWPETLVVDAATFKFAAHDTATGRVAFDVLAAAGSGGQIVRVAAVKQENREAWEQFFSELPGVPLVVTGDAGHGMAAATDFFPDAIGLHCEWHLRESILNALPSNVDRADPIRSVISKALTSQAAWEEMKHAVRARFPRSKNLSKAIDRVADTRAADRAALAQVPDVHPARSTGAVEQFFSRLEGLLHGRVQNMTNPHRTNALLQLLAAGRNGWVDEQTWAQLLRDYLIARDGVAPKQRHHTEERASRTLAQYRDTPASRRRKAAIAVIQEEHEQAMADYGPDDPPF